MKNSGVVPSGAVTATDLWCEYAVDPVGIDVADPRSSLVLRPDPAALRFSDTLKLLLLNVTAADGTRRRVVCDTTWQVGRGPIARNSFTLTGW